MQVGLAVTFWEVSSLNLSCVTSYPETNQANVRIVPWYRTQLPPSKSLPIQHPWSYYLF